MPSDLDTQVQFVLHPACERGQADHGWLSTYHSFSFAGWHDPSKMHFGALRVLNDDDVAGGGGFGTHPHDNMEIVTIPTSGALEHKDSMGNSSVIREGDVQVMSAGTGIWHSEFNHSSGEAVRFFQVWIYPDTRDLTPRYDQKKCGAGVANDGFTTLVTPDGSAGVRIHQNAYFQWGNFRAGHTVDYAMHGAGQGVYVMVIEGEAEVLGKKLGRRDAIGVWDTASLSLTASSDCELLLIEVPMRW
ncbi:MAG: hypothetical protein CMC97_04020 [Flavobacteriales bacterium]|nr:hypothetical protein [Flavobacteriales bacterium]